jgi:nucleoside-diphosphate-sugar epimerase
MREAEISKHILVTGALGLVGRAVAARLAADGGCVTRVDSVASESEGVLGIDLAQDAWPKRHWAAIVHCAARLPMKFEGAEAEAASAENRCLDDRAIDEAIMCGAHLIYFSSGSVYGDTLGVIDEDTAPRPKISYANEKLASEAAIASRHASATVFRLVAPYGERQTRPTVLRRFIELALSAQTLRYYGSGARTQDFLHVDDVAQAVSLAISQRACGRWLLASGVATGMKQLAERVVEVTSSKSAVEAAGIADPEEGRKIEYCIDRLRTQLGFVPAVTLDAGIARWASALRAERDFGETHA